MQPAESDDAEPNADPAAWAADQVDSARATTNSPNAMSDSSPGADSSAGRATETTADGQEAEAMDIAQDVEQPSAQAGIATAHEQHGFLLGPTCVGDHVGNRLASRTAVTLSNEWLQCESKAGLDAVSSGAHGLCTLVLGCNSRVHQQLLRALCNMSM